MPDRSAASHAQILEYRTRLLERLAGQPAAFAALAAGLSEADWRTRRGLDGTSLHQLLTHLRDAEAQAYWPRIQRILQEDHPWLDPFPHHRWSLAEYQPAVTAAEILAALARTRVEVLTGLQPLPPEAWSRAGFHPPSGPRTLQWWVERLYTHAAKHFDEMQAAVAAPPARPDPYAGDFQ